MDFNNLLVSTKFAPPRIGARFIPRKALLDRLAAARRCTLTLVTGSAGFGKTILLAQWRQELLKAGGEVAWLSLGHEERQFANFCTYLCAALQRVGISVESNMLFEGGGSDVVDAVVAGVVNGAVDLPKEMHLFIDDYHYADDPWAHKLMQKLLDHCPGNLHIVIASRMLPPLNIARLRVMAEVAEIGLDELPFDLEETRLFFSQSLGTAKLNSDEVRLIHDLTGGWPASLQLITIELRNRPQLRSSLHDFGWKIRDLQAYFAEDVVAHLPKDFVEFMEMISICRRFSAPLAECVTGVSNAGKLIQRAEDENLLIYRVDSDDRSPWYRFHPLFSDFLAVRLKERGADAIKALHARASRWFAEHDLLVEAIRHAIQADDLAFAVSTIENAAPATWSLAHLGPMLHLLDRLPQEMLFAYPKLYFLGCLTYALTARPAKAEKWIADIRKSEAAKQPSISSRFALADAAVALQRDDTSRIIDLLEPLKNVVPENRFLLYVFIATLAPAYAAAGQYAKAHKLADDHPIPPEDRMNDMALVAECIRPTIFLIEGNVREVVNWGAPVLERSESAFGRQCLSAKICASFLADAYYELDRIDEAREVLANRFALYQAMAPGMMLHSAVCHARLDFLLESPDDALGFLEAQTSYYFGIGQDRAATYMLAEQVRLLLRTGERTRAGKLTDRLGDLATRYRTAEGFRAEIPAVASLALARLAALDYRPDDALAALDSVRQFAVRYGRNRELALAEILTALVLDDLQRGEEAAEHLLRAVDTGARLGLVRTFLDEGKRVGELLAKLQYGAGLNPAVGTYVQDLLERFGTSCQAPDQQLALGGQSPSNERATLTPREIEILGLIAKAMSSKRIALTLNISAGTVKWNVRNILLKLGLSSRYDALTWARKQGLIE